MRPDFTFEQDEFDNSVIAAHLNIPAEFMDEDGYSHEIWAGNLHPKKGWIAWLELKHRTIKREAGAYWDGSYTLKAHVDCAIRINWAPKTYNPFFGCYPYYLYWRDESVIFVYGEKHRIYGCTLSLNGDIDLKEIGHSGYEIRIRNDTVYCDVIGTRIQRFSLPDWHELPEWSIDQAIEAGILYRVEEDN
jgi:hypothetical protein